MNRHLQRKAPFAIGFALAISALPALAQKPAGTTPSAAASGISTDQGSQLKALGARQMQDEQALEQSFAGQFDNLLTPAQTAQRNAGQTVTLTYDQAAQYKEIQRKQRVARKALDAAYQKQVSTILTPAQIASAEQAALAQKAQAESALPKNEQSLVDLGRDEGSRMDALQARFVADLHAFLTPDQARLFDEQEILSLTPDQAPGFKAIQSRLVTDRDAIEQACQIQRAALLAVLTPDQAQKYEKPKASSASFVTADPPATTKSAK